MPRAFCRKCISRIKYHYVATAKGSGLVVLKISGHYLKCSQWRLLRFMLMSNRIKLLMNFSVTLKMIIRKFQIQCKDCFSLGIKSKNM